MRFYKPLEHFLYRLRFCKWSESQSFLLQHSTRAWSLASWTHRAQAVFFQLSRGVATVLNHLTCVPGAPWSLSNLFIVVGLNYNRPLLILSGICVDVFHLGLAGGESLVVRDMVDLSLHLYFFIPSSWFLPCNKSFCCMCVYVSVFQLVCVCISILTRVYV